MSSEFQLLLQEIAIAQVRANDKVIEEACEKALQHGRCGVFVQQRSDGTVEATVHKSVPYGMVYYARVPIEELNLDA
jgi:hypothetical protein